MTDIYIMTEMEDSNNTEITISRTFKAYFSHFVPILLVPRTKLKLFHQFFRGQNSHICQDQNSSSRYAHMKPSHRHAAYETPSREMQRRRHAAYETATLRPNRSPKSYPQLHTCAFPSFTHTQSITPSRDIQHRCHAAHETRTPK